MNPCANGVPAEFFNTAYCTELSETPTANAVQQAGLFPFAQMPCAASLTPVATSSFPLSVNAKSNQIGCPNTSADEASWFQTIFGCVAKTPSAGQSMNQFGESILPAPYPGDLTGSSVPVAAMCGTNTSGPVNSSTLPSNWPWSASCTADVQGNPAVLFTLANTVPSATVYA